MAKLLGHFVAAGSGSETFFGVDTDVIEQNFTSRASHGSSLARARAPQIKVLIAKSAEHFPLKALPRTSLQVVMV